MPKLHPRSLTFARATQHNATTVESTLTSAGQKAPAGDWGVKCELGVGGVGCGGAASRQMASDRLTGETLPTFLYLRKAPPRAKQLAFRLKKDFF